ncbi:rho GTPase-activating protein 19-like, partial [Protobothrops mucrosquamatus]|uniref:rho GTPase-activating protein 19-like n=1 Tax=Protobothrops mucrosquamatus TaxID=103944 RepID=UPI000775BB7A
DDLDLPMPQNFKDVQLLKFKKRGLLDPSAHLKDTQHHTEEALKELFCHVHNMPDSAKKKKLIQQFQKHPEALTPQTAISTQIQKRARTRSFSGLIKRKVLGSQVILDKKKNDIVTEPAGTQDSKHGSKENISM